MTDPLPSPDNSPKPKWLRRLERESWQAELVISGAAIFGSLQLPGLLDQAEAYMLLNFERFALDLWIFVILYFRLMVMGLITVFLFHFIVRALWIGLVGLNSVFPGGIRTAKRFSLDFQEKMKKDYGDVDGFILKLDRLGSGVFGVGFAGVFILLNFGLLGAVLVTLTNWLRHFSWAPYLGITILSVFFLVSVASTLMHLPKFQNHPVVKRIHYPITRIFYRVTYPLNNKYTIMAISLLSYHFADRKGYWVYILAGSVLLGVIGAVVVSQDGNFVYFKDDYYHRIANDSTRIYPSAYADNEHDGIYYRPVIPSATLSDSRTLPVWIPLPDRELEFLYDQCDIPVAADELSRAEKRAHNRARTLSCARNYITIAVNDQPVQGYDLKRLCRETSYGCQYGVQAMVFNPPLRAGANQLRVTTRYPHEEDGRDRVAYVPFYFEGRGSGGEVRER